MLSLIHNFNIQNSEEDRNLPSSTILHRTYHQSSFSTIVPFFVTPTTKNKVPFVTLLK